MEAKVLQFQRPILVKFERFDMEDMAAIFSSKKGDDTYTFTVLADGACDEIQIRRGDRVRLQEDFTEDEQSYGERLVREAAGVHRDQLATWGNLGARERISLLIHWGVDLMDQLREGIQAAAEEDPLKHCEEISRMCVDLEVQEAYLAGLDTARSLL